MKPSRAGEPMNHDQQREQLAQGLLGESYNALTPVQRSVVDLMADEAPTGEGPQLADKFWDRLADRIAEVGGSWAFIGSFLFILAGWMITNLLLGVFNRAFDPYPFIFLNLMLSTVAALQAPVIMMSQNRQAERDRRAAEHDYRVNLRAELEIMRLHDRLKLSEAQLARIAGVIALLEPKAGEQGGTSNSRD